MKNELILFVARDEDNGEAFVGTLNDIHNWLEDTDRTTACVSVYKLGPLVKLVLAVEEI